MKVLSVVGSPRKDGNTAQVVEYLQIIWRVSIRILFI